MRHTVVIEDYVPRLPLNHQRRPTPTDPLELLLVAGAPQRASVGVLKGVEEPAVALRVDA